MSLIEIAWAIHQVTDSSVFWIVCALILLILLTTRYWYESVVFAASLILTTGTVQLLKTSLQVSRPDHALIELSTYSFPSGHAAASMFLLVMVSWLILRKPALAPHFRLVIGSLVLLMLAIGASRVVLGVHTPFEILGGFGVGSIVPLTTIYIASLAKFMKVS